MRSTFLFLFLKTFFTGSTTTIKGFSHVTQFWKQRQKGSIKKRQRKQIQFLIGICYRVYRVQDPTFLWQVPRQTKWALKLVSNDRVRHVVVCSTTI
jgi:hypothetical protein